MAISTTDLLKNIYHQSFIKTVGHIGSNITAAPILNAIYSRKSKDDAVILSSGHAGLALFEVLKSHGYSVKQKGTHPDYSPEEGILASTGSLGHGIGIAVGYALADRSRYVYCVSSDGETAEGSFWEALNIAVNQKLSNLKILINCNGYSAYDEVDYNRVIAKCIGFGCAVLPVDNTEEELLGALEESVPNIPLVIAVKSSSDFFGTTGLDAHYKPLTKEQYETAVR